MSDIPLETVFLNTDINSEDSLKNLWTETQKIWGRSTSTLETDKIRQKKELLTTYDKRIKEIATVKELQKDSVMYNEFVKTVFLRGKLENMLNNVKSFEKGSDRSTFWAGGGGKGSFYNAFRRAGGDPLSVPELLEKSIKYKEWGGPAEKPKTDDTDKEGTTTEVEDRKEGEGTLPASAPITEGERDIETESRDMVNAALDAAVIDAEEKAKTEVPSDTPPSVSLEQEANIQEAKRELALQAALRRQDIAVTGEGGGSGVEGDPALNDIGVPIPTDTPTVPPTTTSNFKEPPRNFNSGVVPPTFPPVPPPEFRETITPGANANTLSTGDMGTRGGEGNTLQSVLSNMDSGMTSRIANRRRNESSIKKLLEDINSFHKIYDNIIDGFKMSDEESKKLNKSTDRKMIQEHYEALELKISNYYRKDSGFKLGVIISAESLFNGSFFNQGSSDMSASSVNTPSSGSTPDNIFTRGVGKEFQNIKVVQPTWTSGGMDFALGRPVQNHLVKTIPKSNIKRQKLNLIQPASTKGKYNNVLQRPSSQSVDWVIKTSKKN
jgi:hypothetical protein